MRKLFEFLRRMVDGDRQQPEARKAGLQVASSPLHRAQHELHGGPARPVFGIVVGFALLLSGIGFGVLAIGGSLRNAETALTFLRAKQKARVGRRRPTTGGTSREGRPRRPSLLNDV
jgi:hypothetical protein